VTPRLTDDPADPPPPRQHDTLHDVVRLRAAFAVAALHPCLREEKVVGRMRAQVGRADTCAGTRAAGMRPGQLLNTQDGWTPFRCRECFGRKNSRGTSCTGIAGEIGWMDAWPGGAHAVEYHWMGERKTLGGRAFGGAHHQAVQMMMSFFATESSP